MLDPQSSSEQYCEPAHSFLGEANCSILVMEARPRRDGRPASVDPAGLHDPRLSAKPSDADVQAETAPHPAPKPDRWGTLMLQAKAGDDRSFDILLGELNLWLHRYFRRRLTLVDAEDAAQEALIAIHCRRYSYDNRGPFGPWLAAIARYKWMDYLRHQYRAQEVPLDEFVSVGDCGEDVRRAILCDTLLTELKPAQARAIRLVKINGASVREAADATGQSVALVKVNIHRGLKRLTGKMATDR